ncbi:Extracellular_nuclease [Hexamita inflata]|uniref:Extracellular nuclease n=1 Tax=Hexamita inflata TaxID=28002 RepID=A0AA86Q617_9EUKA|nr:Extracellular nuclease [Hexamita inflata]
MYGSELRQQLKAYTAENATTLGYQRARQEMYGYIYNDPKDTAVYCIYTGFRMDCRYDWMDENCNSDLNCEHTVPQSFFEKKDPMISDMHHLRPTWHSVNSARSDYPFKTVVENEIDEYWGNNRTHQTKKPKDVENWSALHKAKSFMPREIQRGDTARAVAYFYCRYPTQAGEIYKTFLNVDDMIDWDEAHAPTDLQYAQYLRVVEIQGNRNPFQEERGLVARAYCDLSKKYPCSNYK